MKAIRFKESDYYSVELHRGIYLVDGNVVDTDKGNSKVQVVDITSIKPITRSRVIHSYTSNGELSISIDSYSSQLVILLRDRVEDEDGEYEWSSLEAEFEYRKFKEKWKPVYKDVEIVGDAYSIEVIESVIDTGNKYIASDYINGGKDPLIFTYNRQAAVLTIVRDKFKSLGMEFAGKIDHSGTAHKKIWGNATHSCIRYVTAFNKFVFNDSWDIRFNPRGTLDSLLAKYKSDKEQIEEIISLKYFEYFGNIDEDSFDFKELLSKLRTCKNTFNSVDPKQKSSGDYNRAHVKLNEAIRQIEESYK